MFLISNWNVYTEMFMDIVKEIRENVIVSLNMIMRH